MTSSELIQELRKITQQNLDNLKSRFNQLNDEQLKWRPMESSWNITEIFAHLNQYANYYHKTFKSKIAKTKYKKQTENFISSPLGRSAWKSMKLGNANNVKRKFKTQRAYNPKLDASLVSENDLNLLETNLVELQNIIESSENVNIRRVKIPISISKIIRLRLGDALLFVVYHNQRHMQQAINVASHPNFPK